MLGSISKVAVAFSPLAAYSKTFLLQELADGVRGLIDALTHQVLTAGSALALPLPDCLPLLAGVAESWTAYSSSEAAD